MKVLFIFISMVFSVCASGQELWMQPSEFFYVPGDSLKVEFNISRDFRENPWQLTYAKIQRLQLYEASGRRNLVPREGKFRHLNLLMQREGTKLFVMQGVPSFIEVEAESFNKYLKEHSLDEVYNHRDQTNTLNTPGKETYERCTRLLVQVGSKTDETYRKETDFPLEIIPEQNPYTLKMGDVIRFRILYEGKPLFGARVFVWNRSNNRTIRQPVYSQQDGSVEARLSDAGPWMISVIKMVPSKDGQADWHSYWSNLVFGVRE